VTPIDLSRGGRAQVGVVPAKRVRRQTQRDRAGPLGILQTSDGGRPFHDFVRIASESNFFADGIVEFDRGHLAVDDRTRVGARLNAWGMIDKEGFRGLEGF
jgi:hypothetical protein